MTNIEQNPKAGSSLGRSYRLLFSASTLSNLGDGVGTIAYPWLASAVTRNPVLIALVVVAQRLPWLFMTLPAGVLADRMERRQLMITANQIRFAITMVVTAVVWLRRDALPSSDEVASGVVVDTEIIAYLVLLAATLLLGCAEVVYDNAAQTIMPSLVDSDDLEKANGRLWGIEQVANTVIGPLLGSAMLVIAFAVPFGFDAVTFGIAAVLIAAIPKAAPAPSAAPVDDGLSPRQKFVAEMKEGFAWLWNHDFLRPLAIILGLFNLLSFVGTSTFVLFAQENLGAGAAAFALINTGGALGGLIGGWTASRISKTIGPGASLWLTITLAGLTTLIIGLTSSPVLAWVMFAVFMLGAVLWNVITVSLRQTIIPDELLGRVNSVYRFFAWGMIPFGALLGGVIIAIAEAWGASRGAALRAPWIVAAVLHIPLLVFAGPKLTTRRIEAARAEAVR